MEAFRNCCFSNIHIASLNVKHWYIYMLWRASQLTLWMNQLYHPLELKHERSLHTSENVLEARFSSGKEIINRCRNRCNMQRERLLQNENRNMHDDDRCNFRITWSSPIDVSKPSMYAVELRGLGGADLKGLFVPPVRATHDIYSGHANNR